jgi:hypothetical protein
VKKQSAIVPANPGFYVLILWDQWADEEPFVEAAPVVAWRVNNFNRDEGVFEYGRAEPVAPGWEINADAQEKGDSAVMDPSGRVYAIESGQRFDSMEHWADWTLDRRRRRSELRAAARA